MRWTVWENILVVVQLPEALGLIVGNANNPGNFSQCRQSYHILMTDGYWDDKAASAVAAQANVDGTDGEAISRPGNTDYMLYQNALPYRIPIQTR